MRRFPGNSFFVPALVVLALVFVAEIRAVFVIRNVTARARARGEHWLRELKQFQAAAPAATAENAVAIEEDLGRAGRTLAVLQSDLTMRNTAIAGWAGVPVPADRWEAFLDLSEFVERTRERAARAGVGLKLDERFGFSAYATEGPETGMIPAVFRQRLVVEALMEGLLDAKPLRLLSIQRELPLPSGAPPSAPSRMPAARTGARPADLFAMEPRLSSRGPGVADATAFRLVFVGTTGVLRRFLNRLSRLELPVVVRCVEVEPAAGPDSAPVQPDASGVKFLAPTMESPVDAAENLVPVASPAFSKFTVTVESIQFEPVRGLSNTGEPAHPAA
jgi:hypothetical protein